MTERPVERTGGFTLIELLVVMVIIGVLAAIAIPNFLGAKEDATIASMKSDLRKLSVKQEIHHAEFSSYSADLGALEFLESAGVTVSIPEATVRGWSATAVHPATEVDCALFIGSAVPVAPATNAGIVTCA